MTCSALKLDVPFDSAEEPDGTDTSRAPDETPVRESLFENFVDEIDVWARRALAANGFGDY